MDVTAFVPFPGASFKRGELPFISWREYPADPGLLALAQAAPHGKVGVTTGRIVTGSEFGE